MVLAALDPYSQRQQRRLRDVMKQIADYDVAPTCDAFQVCGHRAPSPHCCPPVDTVGAVASPRSLWPSACTQHLFKAVYSRLDVAVQRALARRPVPPCPPSASDAAKSQTAALLGRQFWSNLKLYQAILAWQPWLAREPIEALACRSVLPRLLLPFLSRTSFDVADLGRYERVGARAPRSLVAPSLTRRPTDPRRGGRSHTLATTRSWRPCRLRGSRSSRTCRSSCSRSTSTCARRRRTPTLTRRTTAPSPPRTPT